VVENDSVDVGIGIGSGVGTIYHAAGWSRFGEPPYPRSDASPPPGQTGGRSTRTGAGDLLKNPENNKSEETCELRFCYEWRSIGGAHRSTVGTEHTRSRQELEQASAQAACHVENPQATS
jgi:hypothetical protein